MRLRISNYKFLGAAALACLLIGGAVNASTVMKMDLPVLVERSDSIVHGVVESVSSQWDASRRTILTVSVVRVGDRLKGDSYRTLRIRQPGGKIGNLNMLISGTPQFRTGEEVIVFLKDSVDGTFFVLGMNQGKYNVVSHFAVSNVTGIELLDPKTGQVLGQAVSEKTPVDAFKDRIRELVR